MNSSNEFKSIKEIVDKNYDKRVLIYKEVENKILNNELFEINKSNWLNTNGEAIIKSFNARFYKFQTPFSNIQNIKDVKPYIIK